MRPPSRDERVNALEIGSLDSLGFDIRVAHLVTDEPAFLTNFTHVRHGSLRKGEPSTTDIAQFQDSRKLASAASKSARLPMELAAWHEVRTSRNHHPKDWILSSRITAMDKVWIDGRLIDSAEARVSVFDRGFLYGDSVYEVTRTFEGHPFALAEHLARLAHSAEALGMRLPPVAEIERAVFETCAAAGEADLYLRIVVTRGSGEIGLDPALADTPRLVIIAKRVNLPPKEAYRDGVGVVIVSRSRGAPGAPVDPSVKSGNYLPSVLAAGEAKRRGAHEAILCDPVGRITEGSSSNIFLVRGGRLATPACSVGLLEGITRRKVLELAHGERISVDELPLWPIDLRNADESFLSSSIRGVLPVVEVDGQPIGSGRPGPVTLRIMECYEVLTRMRP
jgi:branched-chain amino acid aminotransferase